MCVILTLPLNFPECSPYHRDYRYVAQYSIGCLITCSSRPYIQGYGGRIQQCMRQSYGVVHSVLHHRRVHSPIQVYSMAVGTLPSRTKSDRGRHVLMLNTSLALKYHTAQRPSKAHSIDSVSDSTRGAPITIWVECRPC